MKRLLMVLVGVALFTAGYYHTRRQTDYTTARAAVSQASKPEKPSVPSLVQRTFAFRLVNPS